MSPSVDAPPNPQAPTSPADAAGGLIGWARTHARFDVPASLVVFLVAVPLSLGIAVASDAPVAAGLIAAVVGGIVAGLVGGAPLQVSGPAAGLTVVMAETVAEFGWAATCAITVAAGLLQIVLGVTRLGRFALAISPTVVHAMLAAIGISIALGQLNVALGGTSQSSAIGNVRELGTTALNPNLQALIAALVVIGVLIAWPRLPKQIRRVPGPLVAVIAVTVLAALVLPNAKRVELGGSLLDQVGVLELPDGAPLAIIGAVLTVTLIASIESLLSAVAVDKLHDGPRAGLNRELVGQGVANSISGALGGLAVTGVIVRSSTNVAAGAKTRASAILHGVWVLVFALLLVGVVEQIPLAALAGLLLMMGFQLVKRTDIATARQRGELWIYLVTVIGVLALNLVEGVLIGLGCALVLVLIRMARVSVDVRQAGTAPDGRELWLVDVHGSLSFLATPLLVRRLSTIPDGQVVEIDLLVDYLDPAGHEQLEDWRTRYAAGGGSVVLEHSGPHEADGDGKAVKASPLSQRAWLPWSTWQNGQRELGTDGMVAHPLAVGVREFHKRTSQTLRPVFEELRDGQAPETVFIGCVDSRLVPNVLTSSGPGDLLTVRTMGNLVPEPDAADDGSVSAPVLYGVDEIGTRTIVVCGHSGCGAMTAALGQPAGGPIGRWLQHGDASVAAFRSGHPVARHAAEEGWNEVDQLGQVNVAIGLDRVRAILGEERLAEVELVGLFFRIEDGTVHVLNDDRFVTLTDGELTELSHLGTPAAGSPA
ncbi:MAG TPA: bifunctional SulP family inorganic anion transporter/carbonic anhydrase [Propionibacteriaceae bacterium]